MFAYRIKRSKRPWDAPDKFIYSAQYKRSEHGKWFLYSDAFLDTWEAAYKVLEQHANPAALAVKFVGTF